MLGCGPVGLAVIAALEAQGHRHDRGHRLLARPPGAGHHDGRHRGGRPRRRSRPSTRGSAPAGGKPLVVFEAIGVPGIIDGVLRDAPARHPARRRRRVHGARPDQPVLRHQQGAQHPVLPRLRPDGVRRHAAVDRRGRDRRRPADHRRGRPRRRGRRLRRRSATPTSTARSWWSRDRVTTSPQGSVIRRVNLEPAILFGAGRALMLQLAHEAVAQGVEDHSDFKGNPFKRLLGTLEATYAVVYGSEELARGVGRRIQWIHDFVVGPTYKANDPANLLWVHATLCDTALRCHLELVGAAVRGGPGGLLPGDEAGGRWPSACPLDAQPATLADFRAYFDETVAVARRHAGRQGPVQRSSSTRRCRSACTCRSSRCSRSSASTRSASSRRRSASSSASPGPHGDQRRYDRLQARSAPGSSWSPARCAPPAPGSTATLLLWLARRHVRQFDKRQRASGAGGAVAAA